MLIDWQLVGCSDQASFSYEITVGVTQGGSYTEEITKEYTNTVGVSLSYNVGFEIEGLFSAGKEYTASYEHSWSKGESYAHQIESTGEKTYTITAECDLGTGNGNYGNLDNYNIGHAEGQCMYQVVASTHKSQIAGAENQEKDFQFRSQKILCRLAKEGPPVCPLGMILNEVKECVWRDSSSDEPNVLKIKMVD